MIRTILPFTFLLICVPAGYSQDTTNVLKDTTKVIVKLGERTAVKGTSVTLQPPDKFTYSEKIKGFVHPGSAASMAVAEAEGISWIQACQSLTQASLSGQSVSLITQEDVILKDGVTTGRFFVMRIIIKSNDSTKQDLEFERLMLFAGDYHHTVWVNSNYPALLKPLLYATLRESMLSVEINETPNTDSDEK